MKVRFVRFLRKFRGTCRSHAPLMSSFRPKLQRRNEARRLSSGIKSKRNVHPATGKTDTLSFESFWSKTLVQRFLPRCMRYGENLRSNYGAQCFVRCTLCTQQMWSTLTAICFFWNIMKTLQKFFCLREKKYESITSVVSSFLPGWNRFCEISILPVPKTLPPAVYAPRVFP